MRLKQLSDRTLGQAADIDHTTIYRLRSGKRVKTHLDTASAIADALGVDVKVLFSPMEPDNPSESAN